ncbi:MAG TPA: GNAT family N-acetyltransferase [Acidimicrobiales bacterium]|nr:GNAT family N-acetyltransferase [Acidimicrobiales bacterium]HUZ09304.1 GNAT family N-acetyltransferase [Acidimicrobiales bacterium]
MEAVRAATVNDAERLGQLSAEFLAGVVSRRGGLLLVGGAAGPPGGAALAERLPELIGDAERLVLVGTIDDAVIGFALCHLEGGGRARSGVLDACYVEPGARGVGVGRLLLDTAVAWMEEQGCTGVDGTALPGDREAKNFFESAGFKARVLTMYRPLD